MSESTANTIDVNPLTRVFTYNGLTLPDPSPDMTPEQVRDIYSATYAEIGTAAIDGPKFEGNRMVFEFTRAVRDKG